MIRTLRCKLQAFSGMRFITNRVCSEPSLYSDLVGWDEKDASDSEAIIKAENHSVIQTIPALQAASVNTFLMNNSKSATMVTAFSHNHRDNLYTSLKKPRDTVIFSAAEKIKVDETHIP